MRDLYNLEELETALDIVSDLELETGKNYSSVLEEIKKLIEGK